jgi:NF-X1-type zinc finger protein NFXL1
VKKCRCGNMTKETACSKELQCELKCKNQKNCKKHVCNRKCCIDCLPCDKVCGKPLSCGKHKCTALCHDGNCYPCMKKNLSKCKCGSTSMTVNCGRKKNRIPKCKEFCRLGSKCHHEPSPHKCHFGDCSSCVLICSEPLITCSHLCLAKCHDHVKTITKDKSFVPKLPGEYAEVKVEMKKLPHPPCSTIVKINCHGGHEAIEMQCNSAKVISCGRKCDRKLKCGNHRCQLQCHPVENVEDQDQDDNCEPCTLPCKLDRPCSHPCPKECHSKDCKRCHVLIKTKCFCGLTDVSFRCCDVFKKKSLTEIEIDLLKEKYMCCGSNCIKTVGNIKHI